MRMDGRKIPVKEEYFQKGLKGDDHAIFKKITGYQWITRNM